MALRILRPSPMKSTPVKDGTYALTGATIVDATGRPPIPDGVIVVQNGRISFEERPIPMKSSTRLRSLPNTRPRVERGLRIIKALHDAGVPIVAGTDEGVRSEERRVGK